MMLRKWDNDAGQAQSVGYRSLVGHDCFFLRKSIYKKKKIKTVILLDISYCHCKNPCQELLFFPLYLSSLGMISFRVWMAWQVVGRSPETSAFDSGEATSSM